MFIDRTLQHFHIIQSSHRLSFNVWCNCAGEGGLPRVNETARAIRESGADLIGLQEANGTTVRKLAAALGYHSSPGEQINWKEDFSFIHPLYSKPACPPLHPHAHLPSRSRQRCALTVPHTGTLVAV